MALKHKRGLLSNMPLLIKKTLLISVIVAVSKTISSKIVLFIQNFFYKNREKAEGSAKIKEYIIANKQATT